MSINLLTVAPSTSYPVRSGDARRIIGIADGLAANGVPSTTVGRNFIYRSNQGLTVKELGRMPSKLLSGFIAWLKRSHYVEVKHCTKRWRQNFLSQVNVDEYSAVYCHFIFTYPLIADLVGNRPLIVDTHNSEFGWFQSLKKSSRNPMIRRVCDFSCQRISQILATLPANTTMAHVSVEDLKEYQALRPDLRHVQTANGVDVQPRTAVADYSVAKKKLLFIGSLSAKMNCDALKYFESHFWPELRDIANLIVAGSNPAKSVLKMVADNQWELHQDISDAELEQLFKDAHFAILPFEYGAGSKLKYVEACALGVPVLSTVKGVCGQNEFPTFVHVSDSANSWREQILNRHAMEANWMQQASAFALSHGWEAITRNTVPFINVPTIQNRIAEIAK